MADEKGKQVRFTFHSKHVETSCTQKVFERLFAREPPLGWYYWLWVFPVGVGSLVVQEREKKKRE